MTLLALGPLRLSHDDLWHITWGELDDLIYAWRYSEYLESQKRAQQAAWIMNACGRLKHPVRTNDLAGYWVDGQIMSKNEYHEHLKNKVRSRRGEKSGEKEN
jgi:hypothetical protein